jgi:hypothetical protein
MDKSDFKNTDITLYFGETKKESIKSIDYTESNSDILDQYYRNCLINLIEESFEEEEHETVIEKIKNLYDEINKIENKTEFMKNILIDLIDPDPNHGQIEKAYRDEYYEKWGYNYLLSFLRFHVVEQCGNFKDQSLKKYENKDFDEMRKIGNKIFTSMPPPENECAEEEIDSYEFTNYYYNADGGCFNGNAYVELKNGKKKKSKIFEKRRHFIEWRNCRMPS